MRKNEREKSCKLLGAKKVLTIIFFVAIALVEVWGDDSWVATPTK